MLVDTANRGIVRNTDPRLAKFASQADTAFRLLGLTVVCLKCGGTPKMSNHETDTNWEMNCACTRRVLVNPDVH
jgi:hypothetical protein